MKPSRNDPCPCGSGRKYKACHMRADQTAARMEEMLTPQAVRFAREKAAEAARAAVYWEADVAPVMERFRETGEAGSAVMVLADGLILTAEVLSRRPAGAAARARAVLDAVMQAGRSAGVLPERVHVRDAALAAALGPELRARGITPVVDALPELDAALAAMLENMGGSAAAGAASTPWRWAETEASARELAEFHAAAAAFHRAAPWRTLSDADALLLLFPGDAAPWGASVMGGGSIHYGLALYSDTGDLAAMLQGPGRASDEWVASLHGFSLSLSYDSPGDLSKPMRREVAAGGWEVAAAHAYPTLLGIGVPGRRVTAELVSRTAAACRAVVAYVAAADPELPWRDPATGVEIDAVYHDEADDAADAHPWPALEVSHPVGPQGPAADLGAALVPPERIPEVRAGELARLARFTAWLHDRRPSRAALQREVRTAEMWAEMLQAAALPAHAATEHDLRMFLYGWVTMEENPTKPMGKYLTRSLRRMFEYYALHEGIEYPWAEAVLTELDALVERSGHDDVREVLGELASALFTDLSARALLPEREVAGTHVGWALSSVEGMTELRNELLRRWLIWHDQAVRAGITDPASVRDVLVGRQREWENTPHPDCGGRTPRQVVLEGDRVTLERMAELGLPVLPAAGRGGVR